jgi:protein TonB
MEWQYKPALLKGQPVSSATTVTIRFEAEPVRYDDLMDSLASRNEHVREAAARNLGELKPGDDFRPDDIQNAVRRLDELAKADESDGVRSAARRAADRLGGRPESPAPARVPVEPPGPAPAEDPAPAPPGPTPDTRPKITVLDYDRPPKPIRSPKPAYPGAAFKARIEGTVLVEVLIDSQGRVARSRVIQSVPGLDEAALATVRQWLFQPALKDGEPVSVLAHMPVAFRINGKKE